MSEERVWQVRLPDGSVWIPEDSRHDDPRRSWIYSRSIADIFARDVGGTVVEVTRRQKEKLLDQEIASALAKSKPSSKPPKTRTRPFSRAARRAIASAILEYVPLNHAARSAVDAAQETADDAEYKVALRTLQAGLPARLWVGYEDDRGRGLVQAVEPLWITENPVEGEDPKLWREIARDEIARMLVEDA